MSNSALGPNQEQAQSSSHPPQAGVEANRQLVLEARKVKEAILSAMQAGNLKVITEMLDPDGIQRFPRSDVWPVSAVLQARLGLGDKALMESAFDVIDKISIVKEMKGWSTPSQGMEALFDAWIKATLYLRDFPSDFTKRCILAYGKLLMLRSKDEVGLVKISRLHLGLVADYPFGSIIKESIDNLLKTASRRPELWKDICLAQYIANFQPVIQACLLDTGGSSETSKQETQDQLKLCNIAFAAAPYHLQTPSNRFKLFEQAVQDMGFASLKDWRKDDAHSGWCPGMYVCVYCGLHPDLEEDKSSGILFKRCALCGGSTFALFRIPPSRLILFPSLLL